MAFTAQMNRWEPCMICGQPVMPGLPCASCRDGLQSYAATPPTIPMPQSREHAEMMLLVAERYLKDKPT